MTPPTRRELPYDPDPLDVQPGPVRPDVDQGNPGMVIVYVAGGVLLVLIGLAVAVLAWGRP